MTEPHQPGESNPFTDLQRKTFGRLDYCPICGIPITVNNGPNAEREFEAAWEAHRATHRMEDLALSVPNDEELALAQAKAKEASQRIATMYQNEESATHDLAKHFEGVSKIEHRLPQLIDFAFKLGNAVGLWAKEKDYRTKALKLGTIYWTPAGEIAAEFTHDKFDLSAPEDPEYLKRGYARLPRLNALYPAVFELTMTLGEHLINICDHRRLGKRDLTFTNLHNFTNPNTGADLWAFKILNRRAVLKATRVQF